MLAPKGKPHCIITLFAILAALVNFQEAYSNSYPNTAYFSFRNYINESYIARGVVEGIPEWVFTWVWSLVLNIWFIGLLFGVFCTPYMTDQYGRKAALLIANIVSLIGTILCTTAIWIKIPELLFFGRIVASSSCGVSFITLILFLQETTSTDMRGVCSFLSETAFIAVNVIGMGFGLNIVFGQNLVALVGFGAIPGIIAILIMFPLHETPKYLLINRKDRKAAIESLKFYRGDRQNYDDIISNILKESDEKIDVPLFLALKDVLIQSHLRKALILGIMSLQLVVGIWPILYLSTDILETHFSNEMAQYASFMFITANFLASIFGTFWVNRFGRRPLMLIAGILNTFCLILYLIFDRMAVGVHSSYRYGCVASLIGFGITYGGALGPIAYFITSELSAQRYRSLIQSMVFGINTLVNFLFSFITLPMYQWIAAWSFIPLFIIPSCLSLFYLYHNLPETRGKEIHEIVTQMIATAALESESHSSTSPSTSTSSISLSSSSNHSEDDSEGGEGSRRKASYESSKASRDYSRKVPSYYCSALPNIGKNIKEIQYGNLNYKNKP